MIGGVLKKRLLQSAKCIAAFLGLVQLLAGCEPLDVTYFYQMSDKEITDMEVALKAAAEYELEDVIVEETNEPENVEIPEGAGVFSWDHIPKPDDIDCMKENGVSEVYQYMKPEYSDMAVRKFLENMEEVNIDVYILDGEPEWCYESGYQGMVDSLDRVRYWNSLVNRRQKIKGIIYDVEPYVLDKWHSTPDEILKEYTDNIVKIKEEAARDEESVKIYFCIPYSYDDMKRENTLRAIIRESDGVFVLNYFKGREIQNISREVALCKWYDKRIVNVYELQPGLLSQTNDTITYYRDGLPVLRRNFREVRDAYPDCDIGLAYHTLEYLRVLSLPE